MTLKSFLTYIIMLNLFIPVCIAKNLIGDVKAPACVMAGEDVDIEIIASKAAPNFLGFTFDSEKRAPYQYFSYKPLVSDTPKSEATEGVRSIKLQIPNNKTLPLYVWVNIWGTGFEVHTFNQDEDLQRKWRNVNTKQWKWVRATTILPNELTKTIGCFIPPKSSGLIRAAIITTDSEFVPNDKTEYPGHFHWKTNPSSVGEHTFILRAYSPISKTEETKEITINVLKPEIKQRKSEMPATYVDFSTKANVPLFSADPALQIINQQLIKKTSIDYMGLQFPLRHKGFSFVAVTQHKPAIKRKKVEVAQEEDLLKVVPENLPGSVEIPVELQGSYISFLHAVRGSGKLLDTLFEYKVTYADGKTIIIPIKEGVHVAGYLTDYMTTKAVRIHNSLIQGASVGIFLYQWKNPRPKQTISSITVTAKTHIVAFVLGIAGYNNYLDIGTKSNNTSTEHVDITVDFGTILQPLKKNIFSVNDPYLSSDKKHLTTMVDLNPPMLRLWNRIQPPKEAPVKKFNPIDITNTNITKEFPEYVKSIKQVSRKYKEYIKLVNAPVFLAIKPQFGNQNNKLYTPKYFQALVAWYTDVVTWIRKDIGLRMPYIALFNEAGIGRPKKQREMQYQFFNALADSIRKNNPDIKIGGMSECWPDLAIASEFIKTCGTHADFISWNLYLTGNAYTPPFAELMNRTDRYAVFSNKIREANKSIMPDKILEQIISEYNINYKAWDPVDYRLHKGYGAVWTFSVLNNLLYNGSIDLAFYWHFSGGAYGFVGDYTFQPVGTLFYLLNNRLNDAALCHAYSAEKSKVECMSVVTPDKYMVGLVNKTADVQNINLTLLNYFPLPEAGFASRTTELWTVAAEDSDFLQTRIITPLSRRQTIVLPPFSLRILFINKQTKKEKDNVKTVKF